MRAARYRGTNEQLVQANIDGTGIIVAPLTFFPC